MTDEPSMSLRERLGALGLAAGYRPRASVAVLLLSVVTAVFEGVGLTFILPIVEQVQTGGSPAQIDGLLGVFVDVYELLGVPFTLLYLILGALVMMTIRYTARFTLEWLRAWLRTDYLCDLKVRTFRAAVDARIGYFDDRGSEEVLNSIVTQSKYAGFVVDKTVRITVELLQILIYLAIALYLAPSLTVGVLAFLGSIVFLFRSVVESGYAVGDRVAEANEEIQRAAQAGTQGVRDVKLFGLAEELESDLVDAVDQYFDAEVLVQRNEAAITNFYQLAAAGSVFALIYVALRVASLSLGSLGVFLFAMFRLAPRVSKLSNLVYGLESDLPHFRRTYEFVAEMESESERRSGGESPPESITRVTFDDVGFSYRTSEEPVLRDVSFGVERGEFVAFVGPSGAGKSTVAALLARLYEPDTGAIRADGVSIAEFDIDAWREEVAVVRQNPFLFDRSLEYNLTVGNREATRAEIERVCATAQVTEFLDELPDGYDTQLGEDGVQLSGGQRQRVALARALLSDAPILVLDEATSDLDTGLETQVHDAIEADVTDRIVLTIAHRLSTVSDADRIYAVEDGEIVESGTHGTLLDDEGLYADLYTRQEV